MEEKRMSDKEAKPEESIEEALMRELRFGGIDKENLKELVGIVAEIHKRGLKRIKVFPKGIPAPDGLRVTGIIDAGDASRFLGEIMLRTPRLGAVAAFPYGIPWPEIFRVRIGLGLPVAAPDPDGDPD
jgi:hypothetical protein